MRKLLLVPCLFFITSLMSGQSYTNKTDNLPQIDSIVVYSDHTYPNERIFKSIDELAVHVDSLNTRTRAYQEENKRLHSITHELVLIQNERDSLRMVSEKENRVNITIQKWQHSFFFFVLALSASLVASGIVIAYINRKNDV